MDLTENRIATTIPVFVEYFRSFHRIEVRDACWSKKTRATWRPRAQPFGGEGERCRVVAIKVANKVPKGAKTTPFGNPNPTEIACLVSGLRVAVKTAKPLCGGSIPPRASKPFLQTTQSEQLQFSFAFRSCSC